MELRKLKEKDLELLMSWRSHPKIYKWFYEQEGPLKWEEHYNWWKSRRNRKDWVVMYEDKFRKRAIGAVNTSNLNNQYPEVGVLIGDINLWGKGLAKKVIKIVLEYLKRGGYKGVTARIIRENNRSKRLFESLGFEEKKGGRKGEYIYQKTFRE